MQETCHIGFRSAINVGERVLNSIRESFNKELSKWQVDYLVANLTAKRELIARNFFREYSSTPVGEMANLTLLIYRCFEICDQTAKLLNVHEITDLIGKFKLLNEYENIVLRLKSCYNNVLCLLSYENQHLTISQFVKLL